MIVLIAAAGENNALGKDNDLPWHLPDDFKHFKQLTTGHYIIMGRKTFESFPRPLPNRTHVIITRQTDYAHEGCITASSLEDALNKVPTGEDAFIIGGGEIFKQSMDVADCIELTRVHTSPDADAFFPEIDNHWKLVSEQYHPKDEKHQFDFTFQTWERVR